jgi:hypothetical protein
MTKEEYIERLQAIDRAYDKGYADGMKDKALELAKAIEKMKFEANK